MDVFERGALTVIDEVVEQVAFAAKAVIAKGDLRGLFEMAPLIHPLPPIDQQEIRAWAREKFGADFSLKLWNDALREAGEKARHTSPEARKAAGAPANDILAGAFNDVGNAERLVRVHGDDMRFCHAFRKWLVWDGKRWAVDDTGQAQRFAKLAMNSFLRAAIDGRQDPAEKFAVKSLDARRIAAMLQMAESEIFVRPEELDKDPFLLNVLNGTIDLRTGTLRPHDRGDYITKLVHHRYIADARCEKWLRFLEEIMGGGADATPAELERADRLIAYIQRAVGYSMTGSVGEKAVFVLFGSGNNGKSTLLSTVREIIREYAVLLDINSLMVKQESNNSQADLADLRGARFAQTSEAEEGQRLAQGKLKRICQGMGTIKAVRKYENPVEFAETHKLWMDTNRKPVIKDGDDIATFNRLHSIPFTVAIPSERIDRELPAKLLDEAEGILAWAVEGARLWHQGGLQKPQEIQAANDEWKAESDQIGRFIGEECVIDEALQVRASELYATYRKWAEGSGEHPVAQKLFGPKIVDRGYSKREKSRGFFYEGIGIRSDRDGHTARHSNDG